MKKRNSSTAGSTAASAADNSPNTDQTEKLSAKLAIIGGAFATLGDFLATISAALALEEIVEQDRQAEQEKNEQQEKIAHLQRQIDALKQQLERLTKP
ncbi:translation initiation factor 2 [Paenibacillus sp. GCM10023250]|uniref:translation initiation factor 2 n=1 Tax=Paenibacillus sp. GCM10023250 TaxID=3252648 RepID=UPI0036092839